MTSPGDSKKSLLWFWACWLALALTFALFAAASFLPDKRLWGVNHLAFYTPAVRFAVLVIAGFFLVSPLASATWRGILWVARPYFGGLENGYNVLALTGVASFVVFAAFRAATLLLGDGYFIINSFQHAASNGMGIAAYFDAVTAHERIYPATELLNFAASWAAARFGASPAGGVWILNCAVGAGVASIGPTGSSFRYARWRCFRERSSCSSATSSTTPPRWQSACGTPWRPSAR
jgi:hypothetical protein